MTTATAHPFHEGCDQAAHRLIFRNYYIGTLLPPFFFFFLRGYITLESVECRSFSNRLLLLQIIVSHFKATATHKTFWSDKHNLSVYDLQLYTPGSLYLHKLHSAHPWKCMSAEVWLFQRKQSKVYVNWEVVFRSGAFVIKYTTNFSQFPLQMCGDWFVTWD